MDSFLDRYRQQAQEITLLRTRRFRKRAIRSVLVSALVAALLSSWFLVRGGGAEHMSVKDGGSQYSISRTSPNSTRVSALPLATPTILPGAESSLSKIPRELKLISTSPGRTPREGYAQLGTHPENPQTYVAGALLVNGSLLAAMPLSQRVVQIWTTSITA
jgi:hypothetical protein